MDLNKEYQTAFKDYEIKTGMSRLALWHQHNQNPPLGIASMGQSILPEKDHETQGKSHHVASRNTFAFHGNKRKELGQNPNFSVYLRRVRPLGNNVVPGN